MTLVQAIIYMSVLFTGCTLAAAIVLHVTGASKVNGLAGRLADAFCIRTVEMVRSFR